MAETKEKGTKETKGTKGIKETTTAPIEPKILARKLGITPKRLRSILRAKYPREAENKGTRWAIDKDLARKVEADFKKAKTDAAAAKKAEIEAQLKGESAKKGEEVEVAEEVEEATDGPEAIGPEMKVVEVPGGDGAGVEEEAEIESAVS